MNESAPLRFGLPKFDPRDDRQIEAQIDDELTFHIEQVTREFVEAGQSEHDAKINALARFGDVQQIKAQCKHIALEERIMLQRINLVLMIVVLLAVAFVSVQMYVTQKHNTLALQSIVTDISDMKVPAAPKSRGFVYLDGDVERPGVYSLPPIGRLTLSRLFVTAGLSNPAAVHLRVIRTVGNTPEKVFDRLVDDMGDLAENDLILGPNDLVIVAATKDVKTKSDE
ncbi:MAG: permease prefix domain 1-containing protein [Phycisphaerales bacterium]